ncbi:hypothetical protein [Tannockella kyphosi]|uniref:hypothetical protein n=1 Tax=Tannockella kyphosi TaxID=2899121 RepID=UPI002011174C|nr:hypothetical protein [Tannockella kyphosi]
MVSKLEVLSRYYLITIDSLEEDYFVYQNQNYYLSNKQIHSFVLNYYEYYLDKLGVGGFLQVKNCYGNFDSEGYVLYCYQAYDIELERYFFLTSMMIPKELLDIKEIKQQWCLMIDEARASISKHASSIQLNEQFVVLSYYYQGLAEHAVQIINLIEYAKIPTSIQHRIVKPLYRYIVAPDNLIVSSRVRDIALCYKQGDIGEEKLKEYIEQFYYSKEEMIYLYARVLFPSHFFHRENDEMILFYQQLNVERMRMKRLHRLIGQYVYLPTIDWI